MMPSRNVGAMPAQPAPTRTRDPEMRGRILATAMGLVEEGTVEALSMRRLAAELGMAPTAIYWHVGNRNELLDALVDQLIAELGDPQPTGETPAERVAWIARWIRAQVNDRPHLIALAHEQGRSGDVFFSAQAALARELEQAGVEGSDAALAVRAVVFYAGGFVMLEASLQEQPSRLAGPHVLDEVFDFSLDALIRAILPRG
jgi:TetR/AcrR family transcriptional regulator, tetracycline repressor protein